MAGRDRSRGAKLREAAMPATRTGQRKHQILQVLAQMLQNPRNDRITTAALAKELDVSEAALYRHFASKAQMFEGLIEFIEQTQFGLINKIEGEEESGIKQLQSILAMLLGFTEKNPGMTRDCRPGSISCTIALRRPSSSA
jgi:TetR/AcrR family transcriptional regulator